MDTFIKKITPMYSRLAIFVVYFWFGILKILFLSPADGVVKALYDKTINFIPYTSFFVLLGVAEMIIGLMFLYKKLTRVATILLIIHMIATILTLFLVPESTWTGFLVPTLVGQYIIKNIVVIGLALNIYKRQYEN